MQFVSGERGPRRSWPTASGAVAVKVDIASKAYVKALKDAGLQVMMWNINTPDQWQEAHRVGADIVMTDKPAAFGKWSKAADVRTDARRLRARLVALVAADALPASRRRLPSLSRSPTARAG